MPAGVCWLGCGWRLTWCRLLYDGWTQTMKVSARHARTLSDVEASQQLFHWVTLYTTHIWQEGLRRCRPPRYTALPVWYSTANPLPASQSKVRQRTVSSHLFANRQVAVQRVDYYRIINNEKAPRETQTLSADCSKTEPKIFAPPQTPFPGARDGQNLHQLEMVTTFTYRPSLVKIDARNFELSW